MYAGKIIQTAILSLAIIISSDISLKEYLIETIKELYENNEDDIKELEGIIEDHFTHEPYTYLYPKEDCDYMFYTDIEKMKNSKHHRLFEEAFKSFWEPGGRMMGRLEHMVEQIDRVLKKRITNRNKIDCVLSIGNDSFDNDEKRKGYLLRKKFPYPGFDFNLDWNLEKFNDYSFEDFCQCWEFEDLLKDSVEEAKRRKSGLPPKRNKTSSDERKDKSNKNTKKKGGNKIVENIVYGIVALLLLAIIIYLYFYIKEKN